MSSEPVAMSLFYINEDDLLDKKASYWAGAMISFEASPKQKKRILQTRSIVFDCQSTVEALSDLLLLALFSRKDTEDNFRELILPKITFSEKIEIIEQSKELRKSDCEGLRRVNKIRNAFAHAETLDSKKYLYKGSHIVNEHKAIEEYESDAVDLFRKLISARKEVEANQSLTPLGRLVKLAGKSSHTKK